MVGTQYKYCTVVGCCYLTFLFCWSFSFLYREEGTYRSAYIILVHSKNILIEVGGVVLINSRIDWKGINNLSQLKKSF